jgi:protein involved in polysaccharide export with SLBB domain
MRKANLAWRPVPMKLRHCALGISALALAALLLPACQSTGAAGSGIIMVGESGDNKPVSPEEIDAISGLDRPYYLQVGDVLNVDFKVRTLRSGDVPWDYRIEAGDSMEVRLMPGVTDPGTYRLEAGDVIGISFLDNWQLNVTRTVRTDGMVTAPEVGDILARGRTAIELRQALADAYRAAEIIEGEPRVTVNVDFVNLDRYEEMSRDIVVRPDGAIRIPGVEKDLRIAGRTVGEAAELIQGEATQILANKPKVSLIIFPAVDTSILNDMAGTLQVRPDGRVTVRRIGEVQAAGYSIDELRYTLAKACEGLVHNPVEPTVDLLKATGGRIYVGGEVQMAGVYPLEGAPSALQAVMMAKGFKDTSRLNNVIVMRRNPNGKPYVFKTNLRVALTKGHTDNDIMLRPFDIVFVPKKTISKMDLFVSQYIDQLVPFDNSLGVSGQYYLNEQEVDSRSRNLNFGTGTSSILGLVGP